MDKMDWQLNSEGPQESTIQLECGNVFGGHAGWVYNGYSTLCSSDELRVLGILATVWNAAFSLLLCSLPDSLLLELWAFFFFFFFHLCTQGQTSSQAAGRGFFPWMIAVLDISKFVCNGRRIPQCSQGCNGPKESTRPHVLKWILSLWKLFAISRDPAHRQHLTSEAV